MKLIITTIQGRFKNYTEIRSPQGYCFYDVDATERNYIEYIATPILDKAELERKFVLVEGNADELNEELRTEMEQK